jgi:hypothetical protein
MPHYWANLVNKYISTLRNKSAQNVATDGNEVRVNLGTDLGTRAIKNPRSRVATGVLKKMAVREGVEPSIPCDIHTFQACSFGHSDTSPILHKNLF